MKRTKDRVPELHLPATDLKPEQLAMRMMMVQEQPEPEKEEDMATNEDLRFVTRIQSKFHPGEPLPLSVRLYTQETDGQTPEPSPIYFFGIPQAKGLYAVLRRALDAQDTSSS